MASKNVIASIAVGLGLDTESLKAQASAAQAEVGNILKNGLTVKVHVAPYQGEAKKVADTIARQVREQVNREVKLSPKFTVTRASINNLRNNIQEELAKETKTQAGGVAIPISRAAINKPALRESIQAQVDQMGAVYVTFKARYVDEGGHFGGPGTAAPPDSTPPPRPPRPRTPRPTAAPAAEEPIVTPPPQAVRRTRKPSAAATAAAAAQAQAEAQAQAQAADQPISKPPPKPRRKPAASQTAATAEAASGTTTPKPGIVHEATRPGSQPGKARISGTDLLADMLKRMQEGEDPGWNWSTDAPGALRHTSTGPSKRYAGTTPRTMNPQMRLTFENPRFDPTKKDWTGINRPGVLDLQRLQLERARKAGLTDEYGYKQGRALIEAGDLALTNPIAAVGQIASLLAVHAQGDPSKAVEAADNYVDMLQAYADSVTDPDMLLVARRHGNAAEAAFRTMNPDQYKRINTVEKATGRHDAMEMGLEPEMLFTGMIRSIGQEASLRHGADVVVKKGAGKGPGATGRRAGRISSAGTTVKSLLDRQKKAADKAAQAEPVKITGLELGQAGPPTPGTHLVGKEFEELMGKGVEEKEKPERRLSPTDLMTSEERRRREDVRAREKQREQDQREGIVVGRGARVGGDIRVPTTPRERFLRRVGAIASSRVAAADPKELKRLSGPLAGMEPSWLSATDEQRQALMEIFGSKTLEHLPLKTLLGMLGKRAGGGPIKFSGGMTPYGAVSSYYLNRIKNVLPYDQEAFFNKKHSVVNRSQAIKLLERAYLAEEGEEHYPDIMRAHGKAGGGLIERILSQSLKGTLLPGGAIRSGMEAESQHLNLLIEAARSGKGAYLVNELGEEWFRGKSGKTMSLGREERIFFPDEDGEVIAHHKLPHRFAGGPVKAGYDPREERVALDKAPAWMNLLKAAYQSPAFNTGGGLSAFFQMNRGPLPTGPTSKVHVAALESEAQQILDIVDDVAKDMRVTFKWVKSPIELRKGEAFGPGGIQEGKFITAYPKPEDAKKFVERIDEALRAKGIGKGTVNPRERRYAPDSPITHRYTSDVAGRDAAQDAAERMALNGAYDLPGAVDYVGTRAGSGSRAIRGRTKRPQRQQRSGLEGFCPICGAGPFIAETFYDRHMATHAASSAAATAPGAAPMAASTAKVIRDKPKPREYAGQLLAEPKSGLGPPYKKFRDAFPGERAAIAAGQLSPGGSIQRVFVVNPLTIAKMPVLMTSEGGGGKVPRARSTAKTIKGGLTDTSAGADVDTEPLGMSAPVSRAEATIRARASVRRMRSQLVDVQQKIAEDIQYTPARAITTAITQVLMNTLGGRQNILARTKVATSFANEAQKAVSDYQGQLKLVDELEQKVKEPGTPAQMKRRQQALAHAQSELGKFQEGAERASTRASLFSFGLGGARRQVEIEAKDDAERQRLLKYIKEEAPRVDKYRLGNGQNFGLRGPVTLGTAGRALGIGTVGALGAGVLFQAGLQATSAAFDAITMALSKAYDSITNFSLSLNQARDTLSKQVAGQPFPASAQAGALARLGLGPVDIQSLRGISQQSTLLAGAQALQQIVALRRGQANLSRPGATPGLEVGFGNGLVPGIPLLQNINETPGIGTQIQGELERAGGAFDWLGNIINKTVTGGGVGAGVGATVGGIAGLVGGPLSALGVVGGGVAGGVGGGGLGLLSGIGDVLLNPPKPIDLNKMGQTAAFWARLAEQGNRAQGIAGPMLVKTASGEQLAVSIEAFKADGLEKLGTTLAQAGYAITTPSGEAPNAQTVKQLLTSIGIGPNVPNAAGLWQQALGAGGGMAGPLSTQMAINLDNARFARQTALPVARGYEYFLNRPTTPGAGTPGGGFLPETVEAQKRLAELSQQGRDFIKLHVDPAIYQELDQVSQKLHDNRELTIKINADFQQEQFNYQLGLAKRNAGDLLGLANRQAATVHGELVDVTQLGKLQREQLLNSRAMQELELQHSQRQINFNKAIAEISVAGETPAEMAARLRDSRLESQYAQDQLDLQKKGYQLGVKIEDISISRQAQDALDQLGLFKKGYEIQVQTQQLEEANTFLSEQQNWLTQIAQTYTDPILANQKLVQDTAHSIAMETGDWDGAMANIPGYYTQANTEALKLLGTLQQIPPPTGTYQPLPPGIQGPLAPNNLLQPPREDWGPTHASGLVGMTKGTTNLGYAGEAGGELVAVLRNPRPLDLGGWAGGGGGGGTTINFINTQVRDDSDIDTIARRVERIMDDRARMVVGG